jgi:hypothetical protein
LSGASRGAWGAASPEGDEDDDEEEEVASFVEANIGVSSGLGLVVFILGNPYTRFFGVSVLSRSQPISTPSQPISADLLLLTGFKKERDREVKGRLEMASEGRCQRRKEKPTPPLWELKLPAEVTVARQLGARFSR